MKTVNLMPIHMHPINKAPPLGANLDLVAAYLFVLLAVDAAI